MEDVEKEIKQIKEFYDSVVVLPEFSGFQRDPPTKIYDIIETSTSDDVWEYIKKLLALIMSVEHAGTGIAICEFIPSLIWSHLRGILEKRNALRNLAEKIILTIFNDKHLREQARCFSDVVLRDALYNEDDKDRMNLWTLPKEESHRKETTSRLYDISSIFNSTIINVDKNTKGLDNLPDQLKYIPLGQCIDVYSQLIDLICKFSKHISNECLFRIIRFVHLVCRIGYSPNLYDEPPSFLLPRELQFILNPSYVRVNLTNYIVERFTFLIQRTIYRGYVNEAHKCAKDLYIVSIKQNLFIASTGLISLLRHISKLLEEEKIKQKPYYMMNPRKLN